MVTVRYYAAARAAAGLSEEQVGAVATLGELRAGLAQAHGPKLGAILDIASFLVDGVAGRDDATVLPADATVDVLPPFAGG